MNLSDRTINALQHTTDFFCQSENSALKYTINYAPILDGETIVTSTWEGNLSKTPSNTTTTASAILSGSPGHYKVVNKITTATQTHERIISLHIKENDNSVVGDY